MHVFNTVHFNSICSSALNGSLLWCKGPLLIPIIPAMDVVYFLQGNLTGARSGFKSNLGMLKYAQIFHLPYLVICRIQIYHNYNYGTNFARPAADQFFSEESITISFPTLLTTISLLGPQLMTHMALWSYMTNGFMAV